MPRRVGFSTQTLAVLGALAAEPSSWRHGYDLARETRLKSGTLYPILIRLADGTLSRLLEDEQPSRPASASPVPAHERWAGSGDDRRAAASGLNPAPRRAAAPRLADESS